MHLISGAGNAGGHTGIGRLEVDRGYQTIEIGDCGGVDGLVANDKGHVQNRFAAYGGHIV